MEIISMNYRCLHFRYNKRRYFFGLTNTLSDDASALKKIKTDFIILPSFPYFIEQSLFMWHLEALASINCQHIVVADMVVKKRLQSLMAGIQNLAVGAFKWELMKQHELIQEQLIKVYDQYSQKSKVAPLFVQPNGLGFNDGSDKLNFIVSEVGRSLLLVHQSDTIMIDPPQCIEEFMSFYGLPFDSLKAVILTRPNCYNIFQLLFKCQSISVITTQPIYNELKRLIKAYFLWDETMIRRKMRGKILIEQQKSSKFRDLDFSFKEDKLKNLDYMDIVFALKRIRIYPRKIDIYPAEVLNLKDLDLLILYDIEEVIKKELETSPEAYRKKIIYNRVTRKYNNKYFYTIGSKNDYFTVKAHPYKSQQLKSSLLDLSFLNKQNDPNYCLSFKEISAGERFNASQRVIYVRQGYIKDDKGNLYGVGCSVNEAKEVIGVGNALIMYETLRNVYFNEGSKLVDPHNFLTSEDLLKKVKDNSFVKALKKRKSGKEYLQSEEVQLGSQWEILNSICSLKTYQYGANLGKSQNLYIIVKGAMKFNESEATATKNMGIGNLRRFYSPIYEDNDKIQVIKDAWAIEINMKEMHSKFFSLFPEKMYELFARPLIFE